MNKDDLAAVKSFLQHMKIDILNTRAFKTSDTHYIITVGSKVAQNQENVAFNGKTFDINYGEFAAYLAEAIDYIKKALPYAANEN